MLSRKPDNHCKSQGAAGKRVRQPTQDEVFAETVVAAGGFLAAAVVTFVLSAVVALIVGQFVSLYVADMIAILGSGLLGLAVALLTWNAVEQTKPLQQWFGRGALIFGAVWCVVAGTFVLLHAWIASMPGL